ncbi:hypothetical protein ACEZ3G_02250 [Maribacter algicola]|uniref:Uncharacterized protein n=1 Tax=Meishania litoralis TaxID=3434685 RepID=A0ACC7LFA5_9FLAO
MVSKVALPILDKKNGAVIGSARYKIIDTENVVVEIGCSSGPLLSGRLVQS